MTSQPMLAPIVVGVDGWSEGMRALRWAADEAVRAGTWLHVVHAWQSPLYSTLGGPDGKSSHAHRDPNSRAIEDVLGSATALVHRRNPTLVVRSSLLVGDAGHLLADLSATAELVVIGCRGLNYLSGLMLNSVGRRLIAHASGPVVVVRGIRQHSGPIVAALSEGPYSAATLHAAVTMAVSRGAPLHVVHVNDSVRHQRPDGQVSQRLCAEFAAFVEELLRQEQAPGLVVTSDVLCCSSKTAMDEVSKTARLVVVGSHTHHAILGPLFGDLSQTAAAEAGCPVMICPIASHKLSGSQKVADARLLV
jgi:nucleotide-binding universal stress UspA family protein